MKAKIKKIYGLDPLPKNLETWNIPFFHIKSKMNQIFTIEKTNDIYLGIRAYKLLGDRNYVWPETMFNFIPDQLEFNFDE